ncbi:sodium/calcium exchanger membrane region, EF-hand domain pair [Artemisia annua]|uniref:Sodium/calcium exchanger membrane region, EF-hand domain pair n=1 Tax=Artemisia annua TaxID=35608 RepID=A0A2U1PTP8_ARTAN|nr:sodium/calcium exchanger membrane region, EF-hand domain pair [Artemisia annua]
MVKVAKITCYALFILIVLTVKITCRSLHSELIQNGKNDTTQEKEPSFLHLKGIDVIEEHCEQMYGFLPCSETLPGHLFLIVVYEYLLYHGESYVASGGKRIFKILGPGIFGASAFHVLGFLPESLILLASGLSNTKDVAQEYVLTGVGLLAGSTILLLTLLWGTCIIIGSRKFSDDLSSSTSSVVPTQNLYEKLISLLTDSGVTTDQETSWAAKIMVISVIPFTILLIPELFGVNSSQQGYIFVTALPVSIMFFFFTKIDQDGDSYISFSELKELLQDIKFKQLSCNKEETMEEIMKEFDKDSDSKVSMEEFVDRFTKWLDETKGAVDNRPYRSISSWKDLYQIVQPWVQTKKKEQEMMKILISEIIRHVQSFPLGNFYNEDGTPNISVIKGLMNFSYDGTISEINSGKIPWNVDEATDQIMLDFDKSGDHLIDEQEFIDGFKEWLHNSNDEIISSSLGSETDASLKPWERWIDDSVDRSCWAWTKAIMLLMLGIAMLALLAEPLIHSVQNVSTGANIPSFFVSFILVPLATNARAAISAIKTANQGKERTTSLTFSELYNGVFMNNVLGFSVLLAVIYFRGLTWQFSGELLAVFIVCITVGMATSFRSKFPIWTSFIAFLLYPLSLIFVYAFNKL